MSKGGNSQQPIANRQWPRVRLGEVCLPPEFCDPSRQPEAEFTYVDISAVDNVGKRVVAPKRLLGRNAPSRARKRIRTGDVLVATTRPNLNAVAQVGSDLEGQVCSTGFCVLRPKAELDGNYLFAVVRSRLFVAQLEKLVAGALYPAVSDDEVLGQLIPLPPLPDQRRIATRLNEQLAAVEQARAQVQAQLDEAENLPASFLRDVFQSPEARQWPRELVEQVCDLLPAKSIATAGDTEVTTVTTACLTETGFNPRGLKQARMWERDVEIARLQKGEILIARSNTPELVGRASVFSGEPCQAVASDLTIRLLAKARSHPEFLGAWFMFLFASGYWKDRASGASGSMKKISRRQIAAEYLPVPPLVIQNHVVARLHARRTEFTRLHAALTAQLAALSALPNALLREAFGGAD